MVKNRLVARSIQYIEGPCTGVVKEATEEVIFKEAKLSNRRQYWGSQGGY